MIDVPLAKLTRRLSRIRRGRGLVRGLSRACARYYAGREDRWTVINDFDGDARMRLDRSSYIGGLIYWRGYHHVQEAGFVRRELRDGMTFLDIGANQGEFTILAAKHLPHGRVIAFEPHSETFELLRSNVALNSFANVDLRHHALGAAAGEAKLYTSPLRESEASRNEGLYSIYRGEARPEQAGMTAVHRLDDVLAELAVSRVDVVKVDVEGAELDVIRGGEQSLRRFSPVLILEVGEATFRAAGYSTGQLLEVLEGLGYQAFDFDFQAAIPLAREDILRRAARSSFNLLLRPSPHTRN